MSKSLSPAAQAVLDAANQAYWLWDQMHPADADAIAAAALRALADQGENLYDPHDGKVGVVRIDDILAIATELEAHHG